MPLRHLALVGCLALLACKQPASSRTDKAPGSCGEGAGSALCTDSPAPNTIRAACKTDADCSMRAGASCSCDAVVRGTPDGELAPPCAVWPCWNQEVACDVASGQCRLHPKPKEAGAP